MKWLLIWMLFTPPVFASVEVHCDPNDATVSNRVIQYERSANTQEAWLSDPTYIVNPPSVPPGDATYWKCANGSVVLMSQAEQDAVNAPFVAASALQQSYTDEIAGVTGDDLCAATLSSIVAKIDAVKTGLDAEINSITALANAKLTLLDMNAAYTTAFQKIAKCVRARAR